ncbi:MAG: hypothetical protein J0L69_12900 [Bacteroidetes bacterium]|nr:hypothetical protein [Bacteroidota bacterium]
MEEKENNDSQILNSLKHLDFFISEISKIEPFFNGKDLKQNQTLVLGLLERLKYGSLHLKSVLSSESINSLEFSAGLTARALLLDQLIGLNLYRLTEIARVKGQLEAEMEQNTEDFCEKHLADGFHSTIVYVEQAQTFGFITFEEKKSLYNELVRKYGYYFEEYSGNGAKLNVRTEKPDDNKTLFKKLANDSVLAPVAKIYDSYQYYSKYDHFSLLYFHLTREPLTKRLENLYACIEGFIAYEAALCLMLAVFSKKEIPEVEQPLLGSFKYYMEYADKILRN